MVTCRFLGQYFWKTGGLKKKREAVRLPKSREVFNSRRENHMYGFHTPKSVARNYRNDHKIQDRCAL